MPSLLCRAHVLAGAAACAHVTVIPCEWPPGLSIITRLAIQLEIVRGQLYDHHESARAKAWLSH